MFTPKQVKKALTLFAKYKSVTRVIHKLGYPSGPTMYLWLGKQSGKLIDQSVKSSGVRKRLSTEVKMSAIQRCFEGK